MTQRELGPILQEDVSRSEYLKLKQIDSPGYSVTKSGLVISLEHPWLAASPDGLVYNPSFDPPQGLVELKNPYAMKDKTVEEVAAGSKSFCLKIVKEANCISQKATVIITKLNVQCIAPTVNGVTWL